MTERDRDVCVVRHARSEIVLSPGDELTFGRSVECTVQLDENDLAISRLAGRVRAENGLWWVLNCSSSRSLAVVDGYGLRSVLPPGLRRPVEGPTRVVVDGVDGTHEISLVPPGSDAADHRAADGAAADGTVPGMRTTVGEQVVVNDADRDALLALFAGYLEQGPRYDPNPKSYAAAAARLGWPRTTLVKRIEYLRSRLSAAGVPNLTGPFALNNLAEHALTTGLITAADLERIPR